jgi:CRP-like cAMP-binding protein
VLLFWLSQLSFLITSTKYIFAMILSAINQDGMPNTAERVRTVGTFLIVLDVGFICVAAGTVVAAGFMLQKKMHKQKQQHEQRQEKSSSCAHSATNNMTHILPVSVVPPQLQNQPTTTTVADYEREVDALMNDSDAHAEGRRQNIAIRRERSHRKTLLRVAQRKKLKESKRMKSVQCFKHLDDASISAIVDAMTPQTFAPGQIIVQQGDPAESFFIIVKGTCVVKRATLVDLVNGQVIGELSTFDHFGEGALLTAVNRHFMRTKSEGETSAGESKVKVQTRNATVIAKAESDKGVDTMMMTGEDLEKLMRGGSNIDMEALMRVCAEEHAQREALSTARKAW